jgi:large repetitive protein
MVMHQTLRVVVMACISLLAGTAVPVVSAPDADAAICSATAYPAAVAADNPVLWYQLSETSGPVAHDSSSPPHDGVYQGGVTFGVAGPTDCGLVPGIALNGSSGYVSNANVVTSPATFSLDIWFKTTTKDGGRLIGFGSSITGASGNYDRHIYMANSGQIYFGVSFNQTIHSTASYNDGLWHEATATIGSAGMRLYIDGTLVASNASVTASAQTYSGSWRVGYDSLGGWSAHPTSNFFGGSVAEASVYGYQLSAAQVAAHYAAATNPVSGLTVTKTASVASAAPGSMVRYTITAANTGLIPLTAANLTDSLDGILDDASYNADATATTGTISFRSPGLTWTGSLAVGASVTITYSVTVRDPETGDKTMTNTATSTTSGSNCPAGGTDPRCTATVTVVTGVLSIAVPASANLGSAAAGKTLTGLLGSYQVTDDRAAAGASWTATVAATGFTTGAGTPQLNIPAGDASYLTSPLTTTGTATFTRTAVTALSGSPQSVVTAKDANGDNSAAWTASVAVHLPASAVAGNYAGVIICSVA